MFFGNILDLRFLLFFMTLGTTICFGGNKEIFLKIKKKVARGGSGQAFIVSSMGRASVTRLGNILTFWRYFDFLGDILNTLAIIFGKTIKTLVRSWTIFEMGLLFATLATMTEMWVIFCLYNLVTLSMAQKRKRYLVSS